MLRVQVVTDSCASFVDRNILKSEIVTVVPSTLVIDGKPYVEGIDISTDEALAMIARTQSPVEIIPPTVEDFVRAYAALAPRADVIISVHASRELFPIWQRAKTAAQQMIGNCEMVIIDSRTLCAAQGLLVQIATEAARTADDVDTLVRVARGGVDRVYSMYFVESVEQLRHREILSQSHAILGAMLGIKPMVTVEEGELIAIEKVKTRAQAVERLVEFAVEFEELEHSVIVQSKPSSTEHSRMLHERLSEEFPGQPFPLAVYSPALALLIGLEITGVVVLERGMDEYLDDDF